MTDTESGVLDLVLIQAAKQAAAELGGELDVPAEAVRYSRRHRRAMAPLGRRGLGYGRRRAFRWAACIVAAMLVGSAGAAVSVEAVRESIINFIFDPDARGTQFEYPEVGGSYTGELVTLRYVPQYFDCIEDESDLDCFYEAMNFSTAAYDGDDHLWFDFSLLSSSQNLILDTEGGTVEEAEVNGHDAEYIKNPDYSILLWYVDGSPFIICGNINKIEMFKIARNIELN